MTKTKLVSGITELPYRESLVLDFVDPKTNLEPVKFYMDDNDTEI